MGELNNRMVSSACEVDIGNAVAMRALALASGKSPALLDWNNNYAMTMTNAFFSIAVRYLAA
jgi:L-fucose isomerase-like protein